MLVVEPSFTFPVTRNGYKELPDPERFSGPSMGLATNLTQAASLMMLVGVAMTIFKTGLRYYGGMRKPPSGNLATDQENPALARAAVQVNRGTAMDRLIWYAPRYLIGTSLALLLASKLMEQVIN